MQSILNLSQAALEIAEKGHGYYHTDGKSREHLLPGMYVLGEGIYDPPERRAKIRVAMIETSMDHMIEPTSYRSKNEAERTKAIAARIRVMDMGRPGP